MNSFYKQIYRIVEKVPAGKVATYGQIAALAGKPGAARAVGWAMRIAPAGLPCHRIVNARGVLAPADVFGSLQRQMLEQEGIPFSPDGRIRLECCLWRPEEDFLNQND